jgi:hypothetical protein
MFSLRTRLAALAGAAALAAAIALPASPAEAQSDCSFGAGGVACYLQNAAGFWAAGDTHGGSVSADPKNGSRYVFHPVESINGLTYGGISNTNGALCWNTDYPGSNYIVLDSCQFQNKDYNEYFAMVPCGVGAWCINNLNWGDNAKVYAGVSGVALQLGGITGLGPGNEWNAL